MPRKRKPKRRRPQAGSKVKLRTLRNPRLSAKARYPNSRALNFPLKRNTSPSPQPVLSRHLLSPRRNLYPGTIYQPLQPPPPQRGQRKAVPLRPRAPQSRASQKVSDKTPLKEPLAPRYASVRMKQLTERKLKKTGKRPKIGKKRLTKEIRSDG